MRSRLAPVAVLLLATACGGPTGASQDTPVSRAPASVKVVATGDIACPPGTPTTRVTCRQAATARLAGSLAPDHVLALGDLQYERGALQAYNHAYDDSWGALKAITHPVPGNHEYGTAGAAGYFGYFDGTPGWYAWDAGDWRVYNLDSNCGHVDCTAERDWLVADLEANPRGCSMIVTHHPRWSSGEHGSQPVVARFWRVAYAHHVDVALAGHDHDYERFAAMDPAGTLRPGRGIQSFVVGTGGKSLYAMTHHPAGSRFFQDRRFGVLALSLRAAGWTWRYRTVDGTVRDSGSRSCV